MRYTPISLRQLGLETYLNKTTPQHNGFGYQDFCILYDARVNPTNLARAFNVKTRETILHWIEIYKEELKAKNSI